MVPQYLQIHLELPQYEEAFLRCEMTGLRLIALDAAAAVPLAIPHPLHRMKLLTHAADLRKTVLEKAAKARPPEVPHTFYYSLFALSLPLSLSLSLPCTSQPRWPL
jgi:hypothetical protein